MASAVTKSKLNLSGLAVMLCKNLLFAMDSIDIYCVDTGEVIKAENDFTTAIGLNVKASGAYYTAFGYHYVLCFDTENRENFVSIIKVNNCGMKEEIAKVSPKEVISHAN